MVDEIIKELWDIKDQIAKEHGYNIDRFVAYLREMSEKKDSHAIDSSGLKKNPSTRK